MTRKAKSSQPGFTLLEVIMATAVLALVCVPLFKAFGTGLRTAGSVATREVAFLHARSKLAQAAGERPLEAGSQIGEFENGMTWEVTIEPLDLPEQADLDKILAQIYEITVVISDPDGQEVELQAIRSQYEELTQ